MATHRLSSWFVLALSAALLASPLDAQAPAAVKARPFVTPRFRVDVPEKDWRVLPGGVDTLATLAHKDGSAVAVIEQEELQIALGPQDIDRNFVELEVASITEREVGGSGFKGQLLTRGKQPVVVVDYQRRGVTGDEQVRVFVTVSEKRLLRFACSAPVATFQKMAPVFAQMGASLQAIDQSR